MFICALIAAAVHIPLNVLFISTLGWGPVGAAAATWISDLILLLLLLAFIISSGVYKQSWGGFSPRQCFREWGPFLALAVPSCFSVCLEWWCYEALLLAAGLLEVRTALRRALRMCADGFVFMYKFLTSPGGKFFASAYAASNN